LGTSAEAETTTGYRPLTLGGHAVRWQPKEGTSRIVLHYRIADDEIHQPKAINCKRMRSPQTLLGSSKLDQDAFRRALDIAFQRWRDVADVTFVEAAPGERPDIVVGEQSDPTGFAFTNVELAEQGDARSRPIVGATICLNPEHKWKIGYDGNLAVYDLVHTLTHEIGHAIGLDHPVGRDHLMSFRYTEVRDGLSEGDRKGAVAIYGPSRLQSAVIADPSTTTAGPPSVTTVIGRSLDRAAPD
jgi:hypothetical protein